MDPGGCVEIDQLAVGCRICRYSSGGVLLGRETLRMAEVGMGVGENVILRNSGSLAEIQGYRRLSSFVSSATLISAKP